MNRYVFILLLVGAHAFNLKYLDPTKLQTITPASEQQNAALSIISSYVPNLPSNQFTVEVDPDFFSDKKDAFSLKSANGQLHIKASTGVAAVWGFNYYLKKYCKSQIAWQVKRVVIPNSLPEVNVVIVANDRFRYYQNVCTLSYSFVWWQYSSWKDHIDWMALNGINLALVPAAQEYVWSQIYKEIGMTDDEIDQYFTGPAFLSWLRMGNVHGWGGPLSQSWHDAQYSIQRNVISYMLQLGIVPVMPAFNGHVPKAFARIYPNSTFHSVEKWNKFGEDYCCGLFLDPNDPVFKEIGIKFLRKVAGNSRRSGHIYSADPFNEIKIQLWSTALIQDTAKAIYSTLQEFDNEAVWLVQNWMFVSSPVLWSLPRVKTFLTSVPNGRMLILDLQAEQWPLYNLYEMYYGQPFIWCMLHNFGGTLGMFGNVITINKDVYEARSKTNSTMIGIGLTPEGINQNYVVYDLMLESAWRKEPITNMEEWAADYAERRYGCSTTSDAWKYLLKSVYSFDGLNMVRGKYVITRRPSFKIKPWAWYKSRDLFEAWKKMVFNSAYCYSDGFYYDLVDLTRQALQYRAEQLYLNLQMDRFSTTWVFNSTISQYLDAMNDMEIILKTNKNFYASNWFSMARSLGTTDADRYSYELNSRNQITMWGPNGEISDYACKQWAELFEYYYIPRWSTFLSAALDAKLKNEPFDERGTQKMVRRTVEEKFLTVFIPPVSPPLKVTKAIVLELYEKWAVVPDLEDLPLSIIRADPEKKTTLADVDVSSETDELPTVLMHVSTTPLV